MLLRKGLTTSLLALGLASAAELHWVELETKGGNDALKCYGESYVSVPQFGVNWKVDWDLLEAYVPDGVLMVPHFHATHAYRATVCGPIKNTSCSEKAWNLERVDRTDPTKCIGGITEWKSEWDEVDDEIWSVKYFLTVQRDVPEEQAYPIGITVQVIDEVDDPKCTHAEAFFNVICSSPTSNTTYRSLYEEPGNCTYNVSIHSPVACVSYWEEFSTTEFGDGGSDNDSELSWGSVFIIVLLCVVVSYITIGLLWNSYRHARTGKQALPHFELWTRFFDYVKAGFTVSGNWVRCRKPGNMDYSSVY